MAAVEETNLTKFIWRIEKFSSIGDDRLKSPFFRSHSATWALEIYPSSDKKNINLNLSQLGHTIVSLHCSIAFIDSNGLPLIFREPKEKKYVISNDWGMKNAPSNYVEFDYVSMDDLLRLMKSNFLFNDTLIVECRISEYLAFGRTLMEPLTCLAQTRLEPYPLKPLEKTIVLKVNKMSSLPPDHTVERVEENTWDGGSLKLRVLFRHSGIVAYVTVPELTIRANFKVSVLGVARKRYKFADVKLDFDNYSKEKSFDTQMNQFTLMTYKNEFLEKDSLSLEFKCSLFFNISFSRLVENEDDFVNNTERRVLPLGNQKVKQTKVKQDIKPESKSDQPGDASETLKNIYEDGFLADFNLKVGGKTFPVHKVILGARSSVFRAMFTADMKEKERGSADIPDVDADTIQRMLKFVYCDSVEEDLHWESVCSLYAAADKYALEPLKQKCCDILNSEMCPSSVLGVLVLADKYQDEDMRSAALDFILEQDKEIIGSEPWSKFAEEHSKLAFDALQRVYLKKIDE